MKRISNLLALVACITLTAPAKAEVFTLATEANNIHCDVGDNPAKAELMCNIFNRTGPLPQPKPAKCQSSWGHAYFISATGPVQMLCLDQWPNDWIGNARFQTGKASDFGGIVCDVTPDSLTCRNRAGHGFHLSKTSQKVF